MKKQSILSLVFIFSFLLHINTEVFAQPPGGRSGGRGNMSSGRFYGKIVEASSGKPVDAASVQLFQTRRDSATKSIKEVLVAGQLTRANGDFSLDNLPVSGKFKLVITVIGYATKEMEVAFDLKPGSGMEQMMAALDKDLGNIKIEAEAKVLENVTVVGTRPTLELAIDRKVFNVEKNLMSAGGTAEDVLKTVPSLSVDIDGNLTMRNTSPQIFVDGRPTTLTIDQIPADAIHSIELITNPSAKYDASGGMAGIVNIVLKKNKQVGYSGNLKAGIDKRGRVNLGGDINLRQGKVNLFASANLNQRKNISTGTTTRRDIDRNPELFYTQNNESVNFGYFAMGKFGIDYFPDNRNAFTFTYSLNKGEFNNSDTRNLRNDTLYNSGTRFETGIRLTNAERSFQNQGTTLAYKHLFAKPGKELTADVSLNTSKSNNFGDFSTTYFNEANIQKGAAILQNQDGSGKNQFLTMQTDYSNPLTEDSKLELGARVAVRNYETDNNNYIYNAISGNYEFVSGLSNRYKFDDKVYAAYVTYSGKLDQIGYQLGVRAESSDYTGILPDDNAEFNNKYPLSLFPSAFFTYQLNDISDLQLSYTRKVNRPNFFQLIPFIDYADSLSLNRGNANLKPEFTNSLELSYQIRFNNFHNILTSAYYKNTNNLITRFQVREYNDALGREVIINSYENANSSTSYGIEITSKNTLASWVDLTTNLNIYNAIIDGANIEAGLRNEQFSYFAKLNSNFKLPANFSIQLTGEYQSKTSLPVNTRGPGGHGWGGQAST
ncbi:MAG TPA: TonB-dependent receptor family protein, partial [Parasegetibacter sp.]